MGSGALALRFGVVVRWRGCGFVACGQRGRREGLGGLG